MKGREIGGVLFVIGVASDGRVGNNGKKGRVCKIIVDVAGRGWRKMKIRHEADEPSDEEVNKWKKNRGDGVDNTIVERDCNCHQLKVFEKKISVGWGRQRRSEWGWDRRHANKSWITHGRDDICVWDLKTEWNSSIDLKKVSTNKQKLALIFGIWNQKKKWKKDSQTKQQMKTKYVRNGEQGNK